MSYEKVVYVGQMSQVTALDFTFEQNVPSPVPPRLAQKLYRSPEFISEGVFLARQTVPKSDAPDEEPVATVPVNAPAAAPTRPTHKPSRSNK